MEYQVQINGQMVSKSNSGDGNDVSYLQRFLLYIHDFLTLSQTTNFGVFQTERVCRRQFQIW